MKLIREHIGFKRGQEPKNAMGTGIYEDIVAWLKDYNITRYRINSDYTIDTLNEVNLNSAGLNEFPYYIRFNIAYQTFNLNWNNLTNMIGSPKIVYGRFVVNGNPFTSLEGIPSRITDELVIPRICGFSEEQIRKVCDVKHIDFSFMEPEQTWEKISRPRPRFK